MHKAQSSIIYDPVELLKRHDPGNRLERYYHVLFEENNRINLVSRETGKARSIGTESYSGLKMLAAQSLLPFERITLDGIENYLDIGSGGGFPAIPILLTQRVRQATLVERTKKKAGALRRMLLALDLKADIISQSFEELTFDHYFDLITLRQVKLTRRLLGKIFSALQPNGIFIYYSFPEFTVVEPSLQVLTYHYSTGSDDPVRKFTIFRGRT
ncbi:MAG: RsmG family class I SAM-dependent methyltransferase [Candidatus Zixiibacteriota bacterium]